ncbi:MAG: heavy-metal-associated domain-containing protein [Solobacterium sp.]|nr:heavy-metal-associated domain-containing protein [Solobacterium sp.]
MIRTVVEVDGMFCPMCESRVRESILKALPAKKASADRKKKEAVVLSEALLDEEVLRRCIEDAGYDVGRIRSEEYRKKGLFGF